MSSKVVDETNKRVSGQSSHCENGVDAYAGNLPTVSQRDWFRARIGAAVGLAVDELMDVPAVRAATQKLKLANVSEFTPWCNFCSCGCAMIAAVRDGKLIAMEAHE
jgi:hypothetical protein